MQGQPEQPTHQVPPALPPSSDLHELLKEIKELKAGLLGDSVTHDNPTFEGPPWENPQMLQNADVRHHNIPVGDLDESLEELVARDARLQYILSPQAEEHVVRSSLSFDQDGYIPQQSNPTPTMLRRNPSAKASPVPSAVNFGTPATPINPAMLRTSDVAHHTTAAPTFAPPHGPYATPPTLTSSRTSGHTTSTSTQTTAGTTPMPPTSIARKTVSRIARPGAVTNASTPSSAAHSNRSSLAHPLPTYTPPVSARGSGGGAYPHTTPFHASGHLTGTALHRSMQLQPTPSAPRSTGRPYASTSSATPTPTAAHTTSRGSSRIPAVQPKAASASASPSTSLNISRSSNTPGSTVSTSTGPLGSSMRTRPPQGTGTGAEGAATAPFLRKHASGPTAASSPTPGSSSPRNPTARSSSSASSYGAHHASRLIGNNSKSPRNNTWSSPSSPGSRAAPIPTNPMALTSATAAHAKPATAVAGKSRRAASTAATEPLGSEMEVQLSRPSLTLPTGGQAELLGGDTLGVLLEDDEGLESWLAASGTPMEEDMGPSGFPMSPRIESRPGASSGGDALEQRTSDELLRPFAAATEVDTAQDAWMEGDADTELNLLMSGGREPPAAEPLVAESSVAASPSCQRSTAGGVEETSASTPMQQQLSPPQLLPGSVASSRVTGDATGAQGVTACKVRELLDLRAGPDPHGEAELVSDEMWRNLQAEASSIFSDAPAAPSGGTDGHVNMPPSAATVLPSIPIAAYIDSNPSTTAGGQSVVRSSPSHHAASNLSRVSLPATASPGHSFTLGMTAKPVTLATGPTSTSMTEEATGSLAGSGEARFVAEAAALAVELETPGTRRATAVSEEETCSPRGVGADIRGSPSGCSSHSNAAQMKAEDPIAAVVGAVAMVSPARHDACQGDEHSHDSAALVKLAAEAAAVVVSSGGYAEPGPFASAQAMTLEEPRRPSGRYFWQQSSNASSVGFDAAAFALEAESVVRHLTEGGADDSIAQPAPADEDVLDVSGDDAIRDPADVEAPVHAPNDQLITVGDPSKPAGMPASPEAFFSQADPSPPHLPVAASDALLVDDALTGDLDAARDDVTGTSDRSVGATEQPSPLAAVEEAPSATPPPTAAVDVPLAIQSVLAKAGELDASLMGSSDTSVKMADGDQGAGLAVATEGTTEEHGAGTDRAPAAALAAAFEKVVPEPAAVQVLPKDGPAEEADTVMEPLSSGAENQDGAGEVAAFAAAPPEFDVHMEVDAGEERCSSPSPELGFPVAGSSSVDSALVLVGEAITLAIGASLLPTVTLAAEHSAVSFTSSQSGLLDSSSGEEEAGGRLAAAYDPRQEQHQKQEEEERPAMPDAAATSPTSVACPGHAMPRSPSAGSQAAVVLEERTEEGKREEEEEEEESLGSSAEGGWAALRAEEAEEEVFITASGAVEATMQEATPGEDVSEMTAPEAEAPQHESEGVDQFMFAGTHLAEHTPASNSDRLEAAMAVEEELLPGESAFAGPSPAAAAAADASYGVDAIDIDMQGALLGVSAAAEEKSSQPLDPRFSEAGTATSHPLSDCDLDLEEDTTHEDDDGVSGDLPHKAPAGAGPALIAAAAASSEAAAASGAQTVGPHPPVKYARLKAASDLDELPTAEEMADGCADAVEFTAADAPEKGRSGVASGDSTPRKRAREVEPEGEGLEGNTKGGGGSGVNAADSPAASTAPGDFLMRTPQAASENQGTATVSPATQPSSGAFYRPPSATHSVLSCREPGDDDEQEPLAHAWQLFAPRSPSAGQHDSDVETPRSSGRVALQGTRGSLRSMLGGGSRLSRMSSRWDEEDTALEATVEDSAAAATAAASNADVANAAASNGGAISLMVAGGDRAVCLSSAEQTQCGAVTSPPPASPKKGYTIAAQELAAAAQEMVAAAQKMAAAAQEIVSAASSSNASPGVSGKATQTSGDQAVLIPAWKVAQLSVTASPTTGASPGASAPAPTAAASLGCRRSLRSISLAQAGSPLGRSPKPSQTLQIPSHDPEVSEGESDPQPGTGTITTAAAARRSDSLEVLNKDTPTPETNKTVCALGTAGLCVPGPDTMDAAISSECSSPRAVTFSSAAKPVLTYSDSDELEVGLRPAWKTRAAPALSAASTDRSWFGLPGVAKTPQLSHHLSRSGSSRLRRASAPDAEDFHFSGSAASGGGLPGVGEAADETKRPSIGGESANGVSPSGMGIGGVLTRAGSRSRTLPGNQPSIGLGNGSPGSSPKAITPSRSTDGVIPRPLLRMSSGGRQLQYHTPSDSYGSPRRGSHYETASGGVPRLDTVSESGSPMVPQLAARLSQRRLTSEALGCTPLARRSSNGGGDPNVDAMRPAWQVLPLPQSPSSNAFASGDSGDGVSPVGASLGGLGTTSANLFASMRSSSRLSRMSSGIPDDLLAELRMQAQAAVGHLQGQHHDDSDDDDEEMQTPSSSSSDDERESGAKGSPATAPVPDDGAGGTVHAWKVLPLRAPLPVASSSPPAAAHSDGSLPVATSRFSSGVSSRPALGTGTGTVRAGAGVSSRLAMASNKPTAMQVSFDSSGSPSIPSHPTHSLPPPVPEEEAMPTVDMPTGPTRPSSNAEDEDDVVGAVHAWKLVPASPAAGGGEGQGAGTGSALAGSSGPVRPHPLGARASLKSLGSHGRGSRLSRTSIRVEDYVDDTYSASAGEGGPGADGALPPADDASQSAVAAAAAAVNAALAADRVVNALSHRSRARSSSKMPYIRPQITSGAMARSVDGSHDSFPVMSPLSRAPLLRGSSTGSLLSMGQQGGQEDGALVCESPVSRALNSRPSLRSVRSSCSSRLSRSSSTVDIASGFPAAPELSGILEEQDSLGHVQQGVSSVPKDDRPIGKSREFPFLSSSGAADMQLPSPRVSADGSAVESPNSNSPCNSPDALAVAAAKQGLRTGRNSRLSRKASVASEAALEDIVEEDGDGDAAPHGRSASGSIDVSGPLHGIFMMSERHSLGRAPPPAPSAGLARMRSPSARSIPLHGAPHPVTKAGTVGSAGSPGGTASASDDVEDPAELVPAWKVLAPPGLRRGSSDGREGEAVERLSPTTSSTPGTIRQSSLRVLRSNSRLSRMTCGMSANGEDLHAVTSAGEAVMGAAGASHAGVEEEDSVAVRGPDYGGANVAAVGGAAHISDSLGGPQASHAAPSGPSPPLPVTSNEILLEEPSSAKQPLGRPSCEYASAVDAKASEATSPVEITAEGAAEAPGSPGETPAMSPRSEKQRRKGGLFACFGCFGGGHEASE